MLHAPYRHSAETPAVRVSTGWVTDANILIALAGVLVCVLAVILFYDKNATARLDCDATGCKVQARHGATWLPKDGR